MLTGRFKLGQPPTPLDPSRVDEELNEIKNLTFEATVTLEAPNVYDHYDGPDTDWVHNIRNYSIVLYTQAKDDLLLKNLPMIGPSLTTLDAYKAVGDLDQHLNYANIHIIYQWNYDLAPLQSPFGKYIQTTETDHHNDIQNGGVPEEADVKYAARMFAELFRRGIYRTYKYELVNQDIPGSEGLFGLLRNDLSEKPSFRAVKN